MPLFGLNVPLVPGLVLPLHIFEPRYRELVATLLAEPDEERREFGIVAVREGHDPAGEGMPALYAVGTSVLLRQAERLDDGRYDIVTTGHRRFRVLSVDTSRPLLRGEVEWLEDVNEPTDAALVPRVTAAFRAYRAALSGQVADAASVEPDDDLPTDPTVLSYLVTAAMIVPVAQRQELVAAPTTHARLTEALHLLRREAGLISTLGCVPAIDLPAPAPSTN